MNKSVEKGLLQHRRVEKSTFKTYESAFNSMAKTFKVKKITPSYILRNKDKILNYYLESNFKYSTIRNALNLLMLTLSPNGANQPKNKYKELYDKIVSIAQDLKEKNDKIKIQQKKTPEEEENWVDFNVMREKIEEKFTELKKIVEDDTKKVSWFDIQDLLLMCLYHFIPPRRLDYSSMLLMKKEVYDSLKKIHENLNVCVYEILDKNNRTIKIKVFFHFGAKATKSKDGANVIVSPPGVFDNLILILHSKTILANEETPTILMRNTKGGVFTKPSFSKYIKRVFKKTFGKDKIGVNLLRKIYISEFVKTQRTLQERLRVSQIMNHSIMTAEYNYIKMDI